MPTRKHPSRLRSLRHLQRWGWTRLPASPEANGLQGGSARSPPPKIRPRWGDTDTNDDMGFGQDADPSGSGGPPDGSPPGPPGGGPPGGPQGAGPPGGPQSRWPPDRGSPGGPPGGDPPNEPPGVEIPENIWRWIFYHKRKIWNLEREAQINKIEIGKSAAVAPKAQRRWTSPRLRLRRRTAWSPSCARNPRGAPVGTSSTSRPEFMVFKAADAAVWDDLKDIRRPFYDRQPLNLDRFLEELDNWGMTVTEDMDPAAAEKCVFKRFRWRLPKELQEPYFVAANKGKITTP